MSAEIDPLGAQLSRLTDRANRDLLWDGDPAVWRGRAPLLFPIVGELCGGHYRLGTQSYALSRHGFARVKQFSVDSAAASDAVLTLRADQSTRDLYPFDFELRVHFSLEHRTLNVIATVRNAGADVMPASFGFHPAFRWPLPFGAPRSSHDIEFDLPEPSPIRRLDANGLVTGTLHPTPIDGRTLMLDDSLFRDDAVILDRVASRGASYGAKGEPRLRIEFSDAPYLGIWTKPGASFICIEPWHGIADPQDFSGDFRNKPGVNLIAPGKELLATLRVTLSE